MASMIVDRFGGDGNFELHRVVAFVTAESLSRT